MDLDARGSHPVVQSSSPADNDGDPYTNFEQYLKKAQEEIGQVFEVENAGKDPLRGKDDDERSIDSDDKGIRTLTHLETVLHDLSTTARTSNPLPNDDETQSNIKTKGVTLTSTPRNTQQKPKTLRDSWIKNGKSTNSNQTHALRTPRKSTPADVLQKQHQPLSTADPNHRNSPPPPTRYRSVVKRATNIRQSPDPHSVSAGLVVELCSQCRLPKKVSARRRQRAMPSSVATLPVGLARAGQARCGHPNTPSRSPSPPSPYLSSTSKVFPASSTSQTRRRFFTCPRPTIASVKSASGSDGIDVDALSAWADDLAREMNSMDDVSGTGHKFDGADEDEDTRSNRALVWWLLTDLPKVDSGHFPDDAGQAKVCVCCCEATNASRPEDKVESATTATLTLKRMEPFVGSSNTAVANNESDSESEEVFEDALEYPITETSDPAVDGWDTITWSVDEINRLTNTSTNNRCPILEARELFTQQSTSNVDSSENGYVRSFEACRHESNGERQPEYTPPHMISAVITEEASSPEEAPRRTEKTPTHSQQEIVYTKERSGRHYVCKSPNYVEDSSRKAYAVGVGRSNNAVKGVTYECRDNLSYSDQDALMKDLDNSVQSLGLTISQLKTSDFKIIQPQSSVMLKTETESPSVNLDVLPRSNKKDGLFLKVLQPSGESDIGLTVTQAFPKPINKMAAGNGDITHYTLKSDHAPLSDEGNDILKIFDAVKFDDEGGGAANGEERISQPPVVGKTETSFKSAVASSDAWIFKRNQIDGSHEISRNLELNSVDVAKLEYNFNVPERRREHTTKTPAKLTLLGQPDSLGLIQDGGDSSWKRLENEEQARNSIPNETPRLANSPKDENDELKQQERDDEYLIVMQSAEEVEAAALKVEGSAPHASSTQIRLEAPPVDGFTTNNNNSCKTFKAQGESSVSSLGHSDSPQAEEGCSVFESASDSTPTPPTTNPTPPSPIGGASASEECLTIKPNMAADRRETTATIQDVVEQRSRLSSTTSTGSSSGSHLKPADVQDFIRRVETSIWASSGSLPRPNTKAAATPWGPPGSAASSCIIAAAKNLTQTVATQTSPPLSRSSSFAWIGDGESVSSSLQLPSSEEEEEEEEESVLSFSCCSLDAVSAEPASNSESSSSSSGESDPGVDEAGCKRLNELIYKTLSKVPKASSRNRFLDDGNEKEKAEVYASSDAKSDNPSDGAEMTPSTARRSSAANVRVLHVYPPYQVPTGDVWVRREDANSQTDAGNGCNGYSPKVVVEEEDSTSEEAYQNGKSAESFSSLSMKTKAFSSSTGGRTPSSTHRKTVRETYSESNISQFSIRLAIEDSRTVKSEKVVTKTTCCSGGSFTIPPSKVRPLFLQEVSSVSAPTSAVSSPMTESPSPPQHSPPSSVPACPPPTRGLSRLDLNGKSSSAPILDARSKRSVNNVDALTGFFKSTNPIGSSRANAKLNPPPRKSQSVKELTELEAVEACKWLRAAGFPQYAQMFEDMQFPINIAAVQKDHYFLDDDSIQSLFRRLNALNRCARMRLDSVPRKPGFDDSDEDDNCAISENWTFQRQSRRWSRIPSALDACVSQPSKNEVPTLLNGQNDSEDSVFVDTVDFSPRELGSRKGTDDTDLPESPIPMEEDGSGGSASVGSLSTQPEDSPAPEGNRTGSFRRTGSERLKDGARAFLRRMESLKTRRSKRRNREAVVISGPHVMDVEGMQRRMQHLACVDLTPPSSTTPSPQLAHHRSSSDSRPAPFDDSSSLNSTSDTSQNSTPASQSRNRRWGNSHGVAHQHHCSDSSEKGAFSDSECSPPLWRAHKDANSNDTKLIENYLHAEVVSTYSNGYAGLSNGNSVNFRTGSFTLGQDSASYREKLLERRRLKHSFTLQPSNGEGGEKRSSLYDNVPGGNKTAEDARVQQLCQQKSPCHGCDGKMPEEKASLRIGFYPDSDSGSSLSTNQDQSDAENQKPSKENNKNADNTDPSGRGSISRSSNGNLRWQVSRQSSLLKRPRPSTTICSLPLHSLSAGQLMMLRKLSLLKLTALMERYSPSNRSGWSWIMPKFIKRMKAPDYKDKVVFGLPLCVVHQRSGQPLPPSIQAAMLFLRKNAMDSVGLFRKSGVRSRIQKLKNMNVANPDTISYEGQQTYDVADMLKQYFRELPEALLTNKMSETFISIYQYIPEDLRMEALQAAIMLMPDENREVLYKLLSFLSDVSLQAHENQMTASNLAVCFAPSLFHIGTTRSSSSSPRRRKTVGVPDQKELNENRAAHECLTQMIKEYRHIFSVPEDTMFQCRYSYIDDTEPGTLDELGRTNGSDSGDWQSYVNTNVQAFLKEARDKFKGWISISTSENADLAFKKIGDGNPLRLWKASVEVEAPPIELLNRVLRERHLWDTQMLKWRVVSRLDGQSEIFQYVRSNMPPLPSRDYCVLRSWRTDLPKGACVLVEVSINHPDTPVMLGDVRGVVLCSRYLIEPCGSGKSRITHISRIDTRGRSAEWYNRVYGHVSALHLVRIGNTFKHNADGPESKV